MDANLKCAHCGGQITDKNNLVSDGDDDFCSRECAMQSSGRTPGADSSYTKEVE
jgi:hypothetical protein